MIVTRSCTSAVSVSLLKRFSSRPAGVVSKNAIGKRNTCAATLNFWVLYADSSVLCIACGLRIFDSH